MRNIQYDKYANYLIVAYAFALPISKAATVLFEVLLIALWFFQGDFKSKFNELKQSKFIIVLSLFLLLGVIAIGWSSDTAYALAYIKKYWHFLVIPIIYTSLESKYVKHIFSGFLFGMLISEVVSYGIFFELIHYKNRLPSDPSPFMDHTNYSVYLSFAAMILLNRIFFEERFRMKIFYFIYFLIVSSSLFINGGRTGQVIFITSLFIVGFINIKNKMKSIIIMLTLTTAILLTAYNVSPVFNARSNALMEDITQMTIHDKYTGGFGQRVALWTMGANVAMDNFIYGTGLGDEMDGMTFYAKKYNFSLYVDKPEKGYIDYHNAFIQYFVQLGVLGFILFLSLFYALAMNKFQNKIYLNINILFIVSFFMLSMIGPSLHLMNSMVLFALFAGMLNGISKLETSREAIDKN